MTKAQITALKGKYGEDKLCMIILGDGKRLSITKDMLDKNEIEWDDGNEIFVITEPQFSHLDLMSAKPKKVYSCFSYESIIGLIFVTSDEDMYKNDTPMFVRNPRVEENNDYSYKRDHYHSIPKNPDDMTRE